MQYNTVAQKHKYLSCINIKLKHNQEHAWGEQRFCRLYLYVA